MLSPQTRTRQAQNLHPCPMLDVPSVVPSHHWWPHQEYQIATIRVQASSINSFAKQSKIRETEFRALPLRRDR